MISAAEISITFFLSVLVSLYCSNFKTTLMVLDLCLHFVCHLFYSSPQLLLSTQLRKIGNVPFKKECYIVAYFSTGGPGSSCEMIILLNKSRGEIIVCMGIIYLFPQCSACYLIAYYIEKNPLGRVIHF